MSQLETLLKWFRDEGEEFSDDLNKYIFNVSKFNGMLQFSKNPAQSVSRELYVKALLQLKIAQCNEMVFRGLKPHNTYKQAITYLVRSAHFFTEGGLLASQLTLGYFYEMGTRPVAKDVVKAIYYYKMALQNPCWKCEPIESILPEKWIERMKTELQEKLLKLSGALSRLQSPLQLALYPMIPLADLANIIFTLTYESESEVLGTCL